MCRTSNFYYEILPLKYIKNVGLKFNSQQTGFDGIGEYASDSFSKLAVKRSMQIGRLILPAPWFKS